MTRTRAAIGLSGGVDSATAAALLLRQGCDVIGLHMRIPSAVESPLPHPGLEDARRVADHLGIPLQTLDVGSTFEQSIIEPFVESYMLGETPNPCVICNRLIKFGLMLQAARAAGAQWLATGHYARLTGSPPLLTKGADLEREQSYFLYGLTRDQLSHAMFPLGGKTKPQVREMARDFGLPVAEKPGSQDICFLGGGDYRGLLARRRPQALEPGPIVDTRGRVLGQHQGIATVTIGQRRGLKVAGGAPLYVVAIHPNRREVVLGPLEELMTHRILVGATNWTGVDEPTQPLDAHVKVRYRQREQPATVVPLAQGRVEVSFHTPQKAPAPGQSAVFYRGDVVLGGGVILPPSGST